MRFSTLSAALFFAATALAVTVTSPVEGAIWDASKPSQSVSWTVVSSDPSSFTIVLTNMQTYPNVNVVLSQNVLSAGGAAVVNSPSTGWPTGQGFQINLVQNNPTGVSILAQSQQFNITGTPTPPSAVSSPSYPILMPSSSSSTGTSDPTQETGAGGDNSTISGNDSGSSGGAMGLTVQTGFIAGLALVGALLA